MKQLYDILKPDKRRRIQVVVICKHVVNVFQKRVIKKYREKREYRQQNRNNEKFLIELIIMIYFHIDPL